jgi:putative colanic acid biosysnthesis UDP-glucose lipid carrier transferase
MEIQNSPFEGRIRPYHSQLALLYRISDLGLIAFSFWIVLKSQGIPLDLRCGVAMALGCLSFRILAEMPHLYASWREIPLKSELSKLWLVWCGVIPVFVLLEFVTNCFYGFSGLAIVAWFTLPPSMLSLSRISVRNSLRTLRRRGKNTRTAAIAGAGILGIQIAQVILNAPWMGYRIVSFFDDLKEKGTLVFSEPNLRIAGNLDELVDLTIKREFDAVFITLPMRAESRIRDIISRLGNTGASVYLVPDLFLCDLMHARLMNIGGFPSLSVFESPLFGVNRYIKRLEDILLAGLALVFLALPLFLIAIGVKLSSSGPVIFKQRRYGLDGREFRVWKFRTMVHGEGTEETSQAKRDDPRITRFGAWLRRLSLDELPQLFNVLHGRMSIVGPRPHAVPHNELYRKLVHGYMLRHRVKPGLTGWAQVNGWRGETETLEKMEKRVEHDLYYIRNWSLWFDFKILLLTIFKGAWKRNAY